MKQRKSKLKVGLFSLRCELFFPSSFLLPPQGNSIIFWGIQSFLFFLGNFFIVALGRRRDVNNNTLGSAHASIKTAQKSNNIYTTFCGIIKHSGASLMQRKWEQKRRQNSFFSRNTERKKRENLIVPETFRKQFAQLYQPPHMHP